MTVPRALCGLLLLLQSFPTDPQSRRTTASALLSAMELYSFKELYNELPPPFSLNLVSFAARPARAVGTKHPIPPFLL